ncbi:DUF5043 domain-containing protein [Bacteroides reticulotermitis]|nr:DUF5043 domain-containing protein [Bacteroides reticulotermitis]MBB4044664.1 hypothetical protein [Bacteroides reticulotermitis]
MRMKILFSVVIGLLIGVHSATAQTNYYSTPKTFNENGYSYECTIGAGRIITLANKDNKYTNKMPAYVTGKERGKEYVCKGMSNVPISSEDIYSRRACYMTLKPLFTQEERKRLRDETLDINMIINPQTGRVMEVYFEFYILSLYNTVPLSTYRKIELELMNKVCFIPSETGRMLDFILFSWSYHLASIIDD